MQKQLVRGVGGSEERNHERGASLVEYALLLALIAMVCVVAVAALGTTTSGGMESDASSLFVRD